MSNPPALLGRGLNTTYPRGRLLHYLALGLRNFAGFQVSKTSVNKRLLLCLQYFLMSIESITAAKVIFFSDMCKFCTQKLSQMVNLVKMAMQFFLCPFHLDLIQIYSIIYYVYNTVRMNR